MRASKPRAPGHDRRCRAARLRRISLVGVAQLVELRVVVSAVAGSNPVAHPQKSLQNRGRSIRIRGLASSWLTTSPRESVPTPARAVGRAQEEFRPATSHPLRLRLADRRTRRGPVNRHVQMVNRRSCRPPAVRAQPRTTAFPQQQARRPSTPRLLSWTRSCRCRPSDHGLSRSWRANGRLVDESEMPAPDDDELLVLPAESSSLPQERGRGRLRVESEPDGRHLYGRDGRNPGCLASVLGADRPPGGGAVKRP
jgi:hypothetical protein